MDGILQSEVTLDKGSSRNDKLACLSSLASLSFFLGLLFYLLFDEVNSKKTFLLIGQVHHITQAVRNLRKSLFQFPAEIRVSYGFRPSLCGLFSVQLFTHLY